MVISTDLKFIALQRFIAVPEFERLWRGHRAATLSHGFD